MEVYLYILKTMLYEAWIEITSDMLYDFYLAIRRGFPLSRMNIK